MLKYLCIGVIDFTIQNTASAMCLSETVPDVPFGRFTRPDTRAGLVVFIPCPQ